MLAVLYNAKTLEIEANLKRLNDILLGIIWKQTIDLINTVNIEIKSKYKIKCISTQINRNDKIENINWFEVFKLIFKLFRIFKNFCKYEKNIGYRSFN